MASRKAVPRPRNYLRDWREFRELTQAQLAAMVGTEGSVISLLESGDRGLSDKWLRRLALPLKTTPDLLLRYRPDQVDLAMKDLFSCASEAKKADIVASLTRDLHAKVVTLPKRREEDGDGGTSNRNEME